MAGMRENKAEIKTSISCFFFKKDWQSVIYKKYIDFDGG